MDGADSEAIRGSGGLMIAIEIERALVMHGGSRFNFRKCLVVPNVSWGLHLHECDLLALTPAGYAHEVEIKISRSDLVQDTKKRHGHRSQKIKYLWFAGPDVLETDLLALAPERAGIIIIHENEGSRWPQIVRKATSNKGAKKFTQDERYCLARLGTIRFWTRVSAAVDKTS